MAEDIALTCQDGMILSGRRYRFSSSPSAAGFRILCWHGWLDNCRSFSTLASLLMDQLSTENIDLVALDFPGHGNSSHKSLDAGGTIVLMDHVFYVYEVMHQLQWQPKHQPQDDTTTTMQHRTILIGHSMGAAVSLAYAAAFPETVDQLIMLDSLGPYPKRMGVVDSLRSHCKARFKGKPPSSIYPDMDDAVQVRMLTAKSFPGNQYISQTAAKTLVEGASKPLLQPEEQGSPAQLQFLHDQRLKWPSILPMAQEQVDEIYMSLSKQSRCKICILLAQDGMPFPAEQISHVSETLQPQVLKTLPGSHHFHLDEDSATAVADAIVDFMLS